MDTPNLERIVPKKMSGYPVNKVKLVLTSILVFAFGILAVQMTRLLCTEISVSVMEDNIHLMMWLWFTVCGFGVCVKLVYDNAAGKMKPKVKKKKNEEEDSEESIS